MKGGGKYNGILIVVMALLGMILFSSLFSTIMSSFNTLRYSTSLANYTAFDTILGIAPVILWLGGLFGAGFAYYKGYSITAGKDQNGFMRMVMGVLTLVLFVTMFNTVVTNIGTVYSSTNASNYTAFTTVVGLSPTVLFLAGIFAAVGTGVSGIRARRRSRSISA